MGAFVSVEGITIGRFQKISDPLDWLMARSDSEMVRYASSRSLQSSASVEEQLTHWRAASPARSRKRGKLMPRSYFYHLEYITSLVSQLL